MKALIDKQIKLKIVLPSILIFLIALFVVVIIAYSIQNKHLEQNVTSLLASVERLYRANIKFDIQMMEEPLRYIKDNTEIQKAWKQKDRELLYALCHPNFESLQHNQQITHLSFIDLDKKVFLRVHNPGKHSDILTRYTMTRALWTHKRSVGVEFGLQHSLTLRNVHPWFISGELAGFVEMGEEIDHVFPRVAEMLDTEIFVTLNKKLFSRKKSEKDINPYAHDTRWNILENSVLFEKTMDHIPSNLYTYLNQQEETDKVLFQMQEQNKNFIGGYIDLKDVKNETIGKLLVLQDVSVQRKRVKDYILLVLIAGIILFLLVMCIVVTYVNMSSSKLDYYHRRLEDAKFIDPLTKIGNRRYLLEKTKIFFAREQTGIAILVDIDNFKKVTDRYGHGVGDEVLRSISKKMSEYVRQDDIFAKFRGDEFVILLPQCALDIAMIKAEAIRHAIESIETPIDNGTIRVSVSMGIYEIEKGDSFVKVIKRTDIALHQAKENGRNRIEAYAQTVTT